MYDLKHCDKSCEHCEGVDRGHDDCCHEVFWISDRCPLYELVTLSQKITKCRYPVEQITSYTGCVHFKLDEKYKKFNEEVAEMIKKLHEERKKELSNGST